MGKQGTTAYTMAAEADRLEALLSAAGLAAEQFDLVWDAFTSGGLRAAERKLHSMKTRQQELSELDDRIAQARDRQDVTTDKAERARLERQISGAAEVRRLIHARHDRQDAEQATRAADAQAKIEAVEARKDAQIRSELRARWQGSAAEFEAAYPALKQQWLADRALGRVAEPPVFGPPKVTI